MIILFMFLSVGLDAITLHRLMPTYRGHTSHRITTEYINTWESTVWKYIAAICRNVLSVCTYVFYGNELRSVDNTTVFTQCWLSSGKQGRKSAAWYLHIAAIPSGDDDDSLMTPKDSIKPREVRHETGWGTFSTAEEANTWQDVRNGAKDMDKKMEGKVDERPRS